MDENVQVLAASHTAEAVQATAVAQEAIEKAREAQMEAVLERMLERMMTNHDLAPMWFKSHEDSDSKRFNSIDSALDKLVKKEDLEPFFHKIVVTYFITNGGKVKSGILTAAVIIGALAVIGGGLKFLLGAIGFVHVVK